MTDDEIRYALASAWRLPPAQGGVDVLIGGRDRLTLANGHDDGDDFDYDDDDPDDDDDLDGDDDDDLLDDDDDDDLDDEDDEDDDDDA